MGADRPLDIDSIDQPIDSRLSARSGHLRLLRRIAANGPFGALQPPTSHDTSHRTGRSQPRNTDTQSFLLAASQRRR
jgi:hypothetical protein